MTDSKAACNIKLSSGIQFLTFDWLLKYLSFSQSDWNVVCKALHEKQKTSGPNFSHFSGDVFSGKMPPQKKA